MKFKYVLTQKRPLDGLPQFTARVVDYSFYVEAVGQTELDTLVRLKSKLEEEVDRVGILRVATGEIEVP